MFNFAPINDIIAYRELSFSLKYSANLTGNNKLFEAVKFNFLVATWPLCQVYCSIMFLFSFLCLTLCADTLVANKDEYINLYDRKKSLQFILQIRYLPYVDLDQASLQNVTFKQSQLDRRSLLTNTML